MENVCQTNTYMDSLEELILKRHEYVKSVFAFVKYNDQDIKARHKRIVKRCERIRLKMSKYGMQ